MPFKLAPLSQLIVFDFANVWLRYSKQLGKLLLGKLGLADELGLAGCQARVPMGLPGRPAALVHAIRHIVGVRPWPKVIRVHASRRIAGVQEDETILDGANQKFVAEPMSANLPSLNLDKPVAGLIPETRPKPAAGSFFYAVKKIVLGGNSHGGMLRQKASRTSLVVMRTTKTARNSWRATGCAWFVHAAIVCQIAGEVYFAI